MSSFRYKLLFAFGTVAIAFYSLSFFVLRDEEIGWGLIFYEYKNELARHAPAGKVIVSGGSAGLFGLRSDLLQKELGRPVLNLSVNGGFSVPFLIEHAAQFMQKGDTLLLMLAYETLQANLTMDKYDFHYYRIFTPEKLRKIPLKDSLAYLFTTDFVDSVTFSLIYYVRLALKGSYGKPAELTDQGDYDTCLDSYSYGSGAGELKLLPIVNKKVFKYIGEQTQKFHAEGKNIYLIFSPRVSLPFNETPEWQKDSAAYVEVLQQHGINTIGEPAVAMLPINDFCNSHYHLNRQGAYTYTARILPFLKEKLARPYLSRAP